MDKKYCIYCGEQGFVMVPDEEDRDNGYSPVCSKCFNAADMAALDKDDRRLESITKGGKCNE